MALNTPASGKPERPTEKENSFMRREMSTMASGSRIELRVPELTHMPTAQPTWASGIMINNTARVRNDGLMDRNIPETTSTARRRDEASLNGLIVAISMASSKTTTYLARVCTFGPMTEDMRAPGRTTRCTGRVSSLGPMDEVMMENIPKTKSGLRCIQVE